MVAKAGWMLSRRDIFMLYVRVMRMRLLRWYGGWLLVGWLLLVAVAPVWGQATRQPDLQAYEQWLREAFAAAQRHDSVGLREVAPRLVETHAVVLTDGSSVPVNNGWLAKELAEAEPDLPRIAQRLGALIDALTVSGGGGDTGEARQQLRDILNRPPFAAQESRNSLLAQLLDWLFETFGDLLKPPGEPGSGPANVLGWIVSFLGAVLVIGVLIYLLLGMRRSLVGEARVSGQSEEERLTASGALEQADVLARGGDYRSAMRYLYLSSLKLLDERGILRYDRALTNREYLKRLEHTEARQRLAPIVETFDRVWYGHAPLDGEGFRAYQQQVEGLRNLRA
jgi:hypothetical protein